MRQCIFFLLLHLPIFSSFPQGKGRQRQKRSDFSFNFRGRSDIGNILDAFGVQLDQIFGNYAPPQLEEINKIDLDFNKTGQGYGALYGQKLDALGALNTFRALGGGVDGRGNPQGSWLDRWKVGGGIIDGFKEGAIATDFDAGKFKMSETEKLAGVGNVFSSFGLEWNPALFAESPNAADPISTAPTPFTPTTSTPTIRTTSTTTKPTTSTPTTQTTSIPTTPTTSTQTTPIATIRIR